MLHMAAETWEERFSFFFSLFSFTRMDIPDLYSARLDSTVIKPWQKVFYLFFLNYLPDCTETKKHDSELFKRINLHFFPAFKVFQALMLFWMTADCKWAELLDK